VRVHLETRSCAAVCTEGGESGVPSAGSEVRRGVLKRRSRSSARAYGTPHLSVPPPFTFPPCLSLASTLPLRTHSPPGCHHAALPYQQAASACSDAGTGPAAVYCCCELDAGGPQARHGWTCPSDCGSGQCVHSSGRRPSIRDAWQYPRVR